MTSLTFESIEIEKTRRGGDLDGDQSVLHSINNSSAIDTAANAGTKNYITTQPRPPIHQNLNPSKKSIEIYFNLLY